MENLTEFCYTPAIVSCLVSLYNTRSGSVESVTRLMDNAVEWHKKKKVGFILKKKIPVLRPFLAYYAA